MGKISLSSLEFGAHLHGHWLYAKGTRNYSDRIEEFRISLASHSRPANMVAHCKLSLKKYESFHPDVEKLSFSINLIFVPVQQNS